MKNQDKRVGKNPAGYLVASIRSDYQAPGDFNAAASAKPPAADPADADREAANRRARASRAGPRRRGRAARPLGGASPRPSATRSSPR